MKAENRKKYTVIGIMCVIAGIAGLVFGNYIMVGVPILGALAAVAGFILVVLGTVKNDELGAAKPVATVKKVEAIKADTPVTLTGAEHHDGIYHGV
jgi:hypothetical protein